MNAILVCDCGEEALIVQVGCGHQDFHWESPQVNFESHRGTWNMFSDPTSNSGKLHSAVFVPESVEWRPSLLKDSHFAEEEEK